jgi:hypothetical protein
VVFNLGVVISIDDIGKVVDVSNFNRALNSIQTFVKMREKKISDDYILFLLAIRDDELGDELGEDLENTLSEFEFDMYDMSAIAVGLNKLAIAFSDVQKQFMEKTNMDLFVEYDDEYESGCFTIMSHHIVNLIIKCYGEQVG